MKGKKLIVAASIAAFAVLCFIAFSYTAHSTQQDTLKFLKEDLAPANTQYADYEVNIGKNVGGATITAELWQDGVCVKSSPVVLNNQTDRLHISLLTDGFGTNEGIRGLNAQIDTNEKAGSELTYFELPPQVKGYSFSAYEHKEVIKANAGEEKILAAMAFDLGTGVRSMNCTTLSEEPERITSAPCLLIVRAVFTAEQIPPQKSTK